MYSQFIYLQLFLSLTSSVAGCNEKCRCYWEDEEHSKLAVECTDLGSFLPNDISSNTTSLILDGNINLNISTIDWSRFSKLETLSLRHTGIRTIKQSDFSRLSSLRYLFLNDNNLTALSRGTFLLLPKLELLDLDST